MALRRITTIAPDLVDLSPAQVRLLDIALSRLVDDAGKDPTIVGDRANRPGEEVPREPGSTTYRYVLARLHEDVLQIKAGLPS